MQRLLNFYGRNLKYLAHRFNSREWSSVKLKSLKILNRYQKVQRWEGGVQIVGKQFLISSVLKSKNVRFGSMLDFKVKEIYFDDENN